jgi:DNA gyrase subunit A
MGRTARGVRGMNLAKGGKVIALLVAENEDQAVLTATENGFGKRTPIGEYTRHGRGAQGMIAIQTTARNGQVVAAKLVREDDEIMLITTRGVLIRTRVKEIREMGRATQGVTLINLGPDERLAGLETVVDRDDAELPEGEELPVTDGAGDEPVLDGGEAPSESGQADQSDGNESDPE